MLWGCLKSQINFENKARIFGSHLHALLCTLVLTKGHCWRALRDEAQMSKTRCQTYFLHIQGVPYCNSGIRRNLNLLQLQMLPQTSNCLFSCCVRWVEWDRSTHHHLLSVWEAPTARWTRCLGWDSLEMLPRAQSTALLVTAFPFTQA